MHHARVPAGTILLCIRDEARLEVPGHRLNPDSAVAIESEAQGATFRSEVDGLLPLSRHR
jgi:hypothetical protein